MSIIALFMITAKQLKEKYFKFFEGKGHKRIPSASLIPENDPTVLFTTAGMHPLVPYLLGEKHPGGKRVVGAQKCVRTDDIDEVGDAIHHTFFDMLGNWSFGDYLKEDAIKWSWEFLTGADWLGLDKNRLAISIFTGDKDAPLDKESKSIWLKLGVSEERIAALPKKNNWWGPAGQTGPCGPDTEMFYWSADIPAPVEFDPEDSRWVEIWNDVFMEYDKKSDGTFASLRQKNVDTGMGVERTLAVLNDLDDDYRTELFWPIIKEIERHSRKKYDESEEIKRAMRIVADHIKTATFIIGDDRGVGPSNTGQGYVVRRLIRRAIRYGKIIGIQVPHFTFLIAAVVVEIYKDKYPELARRRDFIQNELVKEEHTFVMTLERGLKKFNEILEEYVNGELFTRWLMSDAVFDLYQTYGFPFEMIKEIAKEKDLEVDEISFKNAELKFQEEMKKHQQLSRTASAGMFKGGLADHGEMSTKYHTATHLLHAALRQVLGGHVFQKGSNITAERLRFDFSHPAKMTPEEIKNVENLVNANIQADYPVGFKEMTVEEAKKSGALGLFAAKYSDKVKVYTIGGPKSPPVRGGDKGGRGAVSREICGGPHVARTGVLGRFKIIKEEAVSSGVRRIKAVLE